MSRRVAWGAFFFFAVFFILWVSDALAAEKVAVTDKDGDGKPERWVTYDSQGKTKYVAKDSNHDGKPDQFQEFLKGRNLILKEQDRNYDGKIDQRRLMQWDGNKKITTFMDGRPGWIPNPGYTWIWKEEDNDFDGKIDVYAERGNKNPSQARIGQEIQK